MNPGMGTKYDDNGGVDESVGCLVKAELPESHDDGDAADGGC